VVVSAEQTTSRPVRLHAGSDLPPVLADADKVIQVLTNLVDNALRHGEGAVTVAVEAAGDTVLTRIDDEGEGIPREIREVVFTKYWKSGTSVGSGLGLYLVGGLVAAHHGTIEIADRPGGGARIDVHWPLAE
jgi:signal transduction histidine kinase